MSKINMKQKKVIIGTLVILLLFVGAFFIFKYEKDSSSRSQDNQVNYNPPTEEEQKAADTQKEKNLQREQIDESSPQTQNANIVIVDASQYENIVEVRAYVSNLYENGGKCTATLTNGNLTVRKASDAFKDATTTQCGAIDIPLSEFSTKGNWNLKVSYSSGSSNGESENKNVSIK